MTDVQAQAIRRAAFMTAALGATMTAHAVAQNGVRISTRAPLAWLAVIGAATLIGSRKAFQRRSRGAAAATLLALQLALHSAMQTAPWVFGLDHDRHGPLIGLGAIAAHVIASLALLLVLERADGIIAAAVRAADFLLGDARALPRHAPRPLRVRLSRQRPLRVPSLACGPHPARGPPRVR